MGSRALGATDYFDPNDTATLGGSGTFTAQTTKLYSTNSAGGGTLVGAATTDSAIFAGTAGTVTFTYSKSNLTTYTLAAAAFNTTNYILATGSTNEVDLNAPVTLAAGVNLGINLLATTTNQTFGLGSVSGGNGSSLTIQGAAGSSNATRVNLFSAGATISVPVIISGNGTGVAGLVATSTGTVLTSAATVTNNSTLTTNLGATSGNDLTVNGLVSGTAGVLFAAGTSGGSGLVTVNSVNSGSGGYTGPTTLNNGAAGIVRLGANNALADTALQFGVGTQTVGALDLNGYSQTVSALAVNSISGGTVNGITNTSTASTAAALIINGSAATTYSSVIGVPTITAVSGANNNITLSLAATNTGTLTLTGANTYTGATTVSGGTLALVNTSGAALSGTSQISINSGGTLLMGAANQLNAATPAAVTLSGTAGAAATFSVNGNSQGGTTANGVGALTLTAASTNNVIDFGGKAGVVTFASLTTNGAVLTINNYITNNGASGGPDELIFNQDESGNLNNIVFTGDGASMEAALGNGSYEVFPAAVPEPATWFGGLLLVGAVGWNQRRRLCELLHTGHTL